MSGQGVPVHYFIVMAREGGPSMVPRRGRRHALVDGAAEAWIAGSSPAMTERERRIARAAGRGAA
ncbi:MAG: hypothetical protein AB7P52_13195 [Alphaproteobacteria bacterium]